MAILRKTFGWHKRVDRISISQLEKLTGAKKQAIIKAGRTLQKKGLICKFVTGPKGKQDTYYELVVEGQSNSSYQCDQHTGGSVINTHTKETLTKEKNTPISPKGEKKPSNRRRKIEEDLEEKAPRVWVTPSQHADLLHRANNDDSFLAKAYDFYSQWKIKKGYDGGSRDYTCIVEWVFDAVRKKTSKERNGNVQIEEDKNILKKIEEKFPKQISEYSIVIGHNYIEFVRGMHCEHIKVGDAGFREQILNNLRKMNLNIEGI